MRAVRGEISRTVDSYEAFPAVANPAHERLLMRRKSVFDTELIP
jgi:hypothetical protein